MKLKRYIQGNRRGKEANRIEWEAMRDPFLADALEGYDQFENPDVKRISDIRREIKFKTRRRHVRIRNWSVAACLLVCLGISSYFLLHTDSIPVETQIAQSAQESMPEEEIGIVQQDSSTDNTLALAKKEEQRETEKVQTTSPPPPVPSTQAADAAKSIISEDAFADIAEAEIAEAEVSKPAAQQSVIAQSTERRAKSSIERERVVDEEGEPLAMHEDNQALEETVIIGFGVQRQQSSVKEKKPQPAIGQKEYKKYLKENLIRPADDECKDKKGKVTVLFFIDSKGKPYNFTIKKALCPSADKEAIRLIEDGPSWTVGDKQISITIKF